MAKIEKVTAREVLDSRGDPTVQAIVTCAGSVVGEAKVPAGVSNGSHEAVELRDGDEQRYSGRGVLKAVHNVATEINAALLGQDTGNQQKIDRLLVELDGTPAKSRLGANAILAVSLACARAEAASQGLPLYLYLQQLFPKRPAVMPVPQMNLINGGKHAHNKLSIQEYHVVPVGSPSYSEALRTGVEIYHALKQLLIKENFDLSVGDEGGFSSSFDNSETVFAILIRAIEQAGFVPGVDVFLGIDAAATEFYDGEHKTYLLDGAKLASNDLAYRYKTWRERYPLVSVEDPLAEDDWSAWQDFMKVNGQQVQVVGDDLYATNAARIQQGVTQKATNAVLIKPNQVGTLSETLHSILIAQEAGQNVIISHRSGETEDTFIADLAVAVGAGQIKTGAPHRSDRNAKYNRLLEIEGQIQAKLAHSLQPFYEHQQAHYQASGEMVVERARA
jgi:enolase